MRIISQDKEFDIPYEETTIHVFLDEKVIAYSLNDLGNNDFIIMAKYSTKEKAMKAMEMCREQYSQCEFNKLVIPKTDENLAKVSISLTGNAVNQIAEKYVFQFPADEEI